jgi:hypothetical protein
MDNVLISLIERLPIGYLMVLLPILLVSAIWLFTHIRRDKNGKIYFYSQKYEDRKRNRKQDEMLSIISKLVKDIDESRQDRKELHLDSLKQSVYLREMDIEERLYAGLRYIKYGGNGTVGKYIKDKLISQAPISYNTIVNVRPELRLDLSKDVNHGEA